MFSALTVDFGQQDHREPVTELVATGPLESLVIPDWRADPIAVPAGHVSFPNVRHPGLPARRIRQPDRDRRPHASRIDQGLLTGTRWECHLTQLELWGRTMAVPQPVYRGLSGYPAIR